MSGCMVAAALPFGMAAIQLDIRELETPDIAPVADYWMNAKPEYLEGMGVALDKMPTREQLTGMLHAQIALPIEKRNAFCIVWLLDGVPVGHCNTNPTVFGEWAQMHLHLWRAELRGSGLGTRFVRRALPLFFERLRIQTLYCEPYALNPAPHATLRKLGFELEREYTTVPGSLNFEQPVKRWRLSRERLP